MELEQLKQDIEIEEAAQTDTELGQLKITKKKNNFQNQPVIQYINERMNLSIYK